MTEKCFCHMIDPITGETYVVKDRESRESIEDIRTTLSEHGEDLAAHDTALRGLRRKIVLDTPMDFQGSVVLNYNYEDDPFDRSSTKIKTLPQYLRVFVCVGTSSDLRVAFPIEVTFPTRLPADLQSHYIRSNYNHHTYGDHFIYAQVSRSSTDRPLYAVVVKEINSAGAVTDCDGFITRIEAIY